MKLFILFLTIFTEVTAQNLIYIPDINLRNELKEQGFFTGDSLDISKTINEEDLNLFDVGIKNLNGLQYFRQVRSLGISENRIKRLEYLPPNLRVLDCSNNEISLIVELPKHLEYLNCSNNKIKFINTLPVHLKYFNCSNNRISKIENLPDSLIMFKIYNNKLRKLPTLKNNLKEINYSNNPIPFDSLPSLFKSVSCTDILQNCLPYEMLDWKILNTEVKDSSIKVKSLKIELFYNDGWSNSKLETIHYNIIKSNLVANKSQIKVNKDGIDSTYFSETNYSVETNQINQFIKDIYSNQINVQIPIRDSVQSINLKNKKNATDCSSSCHDCPFYNLFININTESDSLKIFYRVNSNSKRGVLFCYGEPQNIRSIRDWLYMYKLTNLTISNSEITNLYFNEDNLTKILRWAK